MSGYNHVTLVGNLTKDPEMMVTQGGKEVTKFTIAVGRFDGVTDFFNCVAWGKLSVVIAENCTKGQRLLVDGRIEIDSYEKDGEKKWVTNIITNQVKFLSAKKEG